MRAMLEQLEQAMGKVGTVLSVPEVVEAIDAIPTGITGYDRWGFNPEQAKTYYSLGYWIYRYFRPVIEGIEHLPAGRALVVCNHAGQLPFDGLVVSMACLVEATPPRLMRQMVERWFPTLPFVNVAFSRAGAVVGDPINCRNLLEADNAILVFPEGVRGSGKTWDQRYKLVGFGRGFMRLALQTGTPVVPVSVIGSEESIISLYNVKSLARMLGMPYFPIPPLLPLLGPLAYLPLPSRFYVTFGEPMRFEGPFDDEDDVIDEKVRQVSERVQSMVDEGLARRESVFA